MVLIPEGEFLMGSPANELNRNDDEGPRKKGFSRCFFYG